MKASPPACLYCRKNLGPIRRRRDSQFCSNDHRVKYTSRSARAIREAEDWYGIDDAHGTSLGAITTAQREERPDQQGGMGSSIFAGLMAMALLLGLSRLPMSSPVGTSVSPLPDSSPGGSQSGFGPMVANLTQSQTAGTLREDFHTGLSGWEGLESARSDWRVNAGEVRPATLRLWTPSSALSITNWSS